MNFNISDLRGISGIRVVINDELKEELINSFKKLKKKNILKKISVINLIYTRVISQGI